MKNCYLSVLCLFLFSISSLELPSFKLHAEELVTDNLKNIGFCKETLQIYASSEIAGKKVAKKNGLRWFTFGREKNRKGEDVICACFNYVGRPLLIDEARKKLILSCRDFLEEVNRDEKLLAVFSNRPIKPDNIQVYIYVNDENQNKRLLNPSICKMSLNEGTATLSAYMPPNNFEEDIIIETYQQAIETLRKKKAANKPSEPTEVSIKRE